MKNKIGAFGAGQFSLETLVGGRPGTTIFQNPGGGGGGLGGGSHTRTGPGRPPGARIRPRVWSPAGGGGGMDDFSLARPNTEEGASQGAQSYKAYVSLRFTFRITLHGCPVPQYGGFESFRVSEHRFMGSPIPQCSRFASFRVSQSAQSRNFGCAHNTYIVCHAMVVCYCVSCGNARNQLTHALRTQKKAP